jgi:hypothetical protein
MVDSSPSRGPFRTPAVASLLSLAALLSAGCASEPRAAFADVVVRGVDYAFLAPDTVPAGLTAFSFVNTGTVRHEVKLIALRPGVDARVAMPLAMIDSGWAHLRRPTSGILTAAPADTTPGRLLAQLVAGETYLLVCHFADSDSAPLHSERGMIRQLVVR